jgi:hypothetical protein
MSETILTALISGMTVLIPALMLHYREIKKKNREIQVHKDEKEDHRIKADVLDRILDFSAFNLIKEAVDELFRTTRGERFLILIAINGKVDFNVVSVIFEQHKTSDYQVNAIARYRSLGIDEMYRGMLKEAEALGMVSLQTKKMPASLLRDIYEIEHIEFSDIRHLLRISADERNDVLVYSSLATHDEKGFTKLGRRKASLIYNSTIKKTLKEVLEK